MSLPLAMFLSFIVTTLGITLWAARKSTGASGFFAAGRNITAWQNGIAVAGDYMSAASFLGIAGIIAFQGYDLMMIAANVLSNDGNKPDEELKSNLIHGLFTNYKLLD